MQEAAVLFFTLKLALLFRVKHGPSLQISGTPLDSYKFPDMTTTLIVVGSIASKYAKAMSMVERAQVSVAPAGSAIK